jgi:pimeloyl-ACP methyl ester carboxylesterase
MLRLIAFSLLASACLAAPETGELVGPGIGRAIFETRTAGTDLIRVTVLYPATDSGTLAGKARNGVVFVQGGFVASTRYEWQAQELVRAGSVVAIPENTLQLAFFSIDAGEAARRLLASPPAGSVLEGAVDPEHISVAGHSLGSVVALKLALNGRFNAVVVEAGLPDEADVVKLAALGRPSLSLAGELDCSASLSSVTDGWQKLSSPTAFAVLEGVTHYQFTDSQAEDEKAKCAPAISLESAHARIAQALVGFLDAANRDGTVGEAALRSIDGARVEVR